MVAQPVPIGGTPPIVLNAPKTPTPSPTARTRMWFKAGTFECGVPFAPREITYGSLEPEWVEQSRPGRKATLARRGPKLKTISFSLLLAHKNARLAVTTEVANITRICNAVNPITIIYDKSTVGLWRCTGLSITSIERNPLNDEMTRASADLEFTEWEEPL